MLLASVAVKRGQADRKEVHMRPLAYMLIVATFAGAVLVLGGPVRADFGCDKTVAGPVQTGTICVAPVVPNVPLCDVCPGGGPPECYPGSRVQLGASSAYVGCTGGSSSECCNGISFVKEPCTCICENCPVVQGQRANYCTSCLPPSGTIVLYTLGACQRDGAGQPVGCQ